MHEPGYRVSGRTESGVMRMTKKMVSIQARLPCNIQCVRRTDNTAIQYRKTIEESVLPLTVHSSGWGDSIHRTLETGPVQLDAVEFPWLHVVVEA